MPRFGPYVFRYDPPITLWFDSEDHTYLREFGTELAPQFGVTSVLKILDKPWLKPWVAKVVVAEIATKTPTWEDGLDVYLRPIPQEEFLDILADAKKVHKDILEDAGDVGTEAHDALENSIIYAIQNTDKKVKNLTVAPKDTRAQRCCDAAISWMNAHNVRWLSTERKIYSRRYEFAGTLDGTCLVDSCNDSSCCSVRFRDRLSLADWKSSNQLSLEYLWQIAAYREALIEETGAEITDGFILRLGKENGEFEPWHITIDDWELYFQAFLSCLRLTEQHEQTKQRMSAAKKARTARKRLAKKVEEW